MNDPWKHEYIETHGPWVVKVSRHFVSRHLLAEMNATFGTYGCPEATWAELAKALVRLVARISVVLSMQAVACPW